MKTEELVFPVTVETFIAHQEELAGGKLNDDVRRAEEAWVPVVNAAYSDGLRADTAALHEDIAKMDGFIANHIADPDLVRFLKSCRWWIVYARSRGRHNAESGVVA